MSEGIDPYSRALAAVESTQLASERLADARIADDWVRGVPLHAIADRGGLHWRQVLDRARALGLCDRCPVSRVALHAPLPPEVMAI